MNTKLIAGILAGIAIGVLIAPDKGAETRRKISRKVTDASDFLRDVVDNIRDKVDEYADESIDTVNRAEADVNNAMA